MQNRFWRRRQLSVKTCLISKRNQALKRKEKKRNEGRVNKKRRVEDVKKVEDVKGYNPRCRDTAARL
jgi:hypothetical protein